MKEIDAAVDQNVIPREKGQEFKTAILIKTEDLIGMGALPKQIADADVVESSGKLLEEIGSVKLLKGTFINESIENSPNQLGDQRQG